MVSTKSLAENNTTRLNPTHRNRETHEDRAPSTTLDSAANPRVSRPAVHEREGMGIEEQKLRIPRIQPWELLCEKKIERL